MGIHAGVITGGLDVKTEGVAQFGSEPQVEATERAKGTGERVSGSRTGERVGRGRVRERVGRGRGGEGKILAGTDGFEIMVAMVGHVFKPFIVTSVIVSGCAESRRLAGLRRQGDRELESRQEIDTRPVAAYHKGNRELVEEELVCPVSQQSAIGDRYSTGVYHRMAKPLAINRLHGTLERIIESRIQQQMSVLVLVRHTYLTSAGDPGLCLAHVIHRLHQPAGKNRSYIMLCKGRGKGR